MAETGGEAAFPGEASAHSVGEASAPEFLWTRAKKPGGPLATLSISIRDESGRRTYFKLTNTTKMEGVFDAYTRRNKSYMGRFRFFLLDGREIWEDDTPIDLELENEDVINCARERPSSPTQPLSTASQIRDTNGISVIARAAANAKVKAEREEAARQQAQAEKETEHDVRDHLNTEPAPALTMAQAASDGQVARQESEEQEEAELPREEASSSMETGEAEGGSTEILSTDELDGSASMEISPREELGNVTEIPAYIQTMLEELQKKTEGLEKAQSNLERRVVMIAPLVFLAGLLPSVLWMVVLGSRGF